ncbi:MAG: tetratricopeptide repeat protein [Acidobacteria bacterium]|nr:tetratricopeptide repeat protein [Acidobacteriota bacterium]
MSKLYNPELLSIPELKRTFVGRTKLVDELVSIVRNQPVGAGVQHVLLIAPRGMGKTTLLIMLSISISESDLASKWQVVRFPEESYDIYDLSDLWVKVAEYLAADTDDLQLESQIADIRSKYTHNDDLNESAYAVLKDWRRTHDRQLLLLVDNLDLIVDQINDEDDMQRLRTVLMNDDTVMLIGSAVTYFQAVSDYGHALYNFFKVYNLRGFGDSEIRDFLEKRAEEGRFEDFQEFYDKNRSRIKTLTYFADGNPRLMLMLFDVITKSRFTDVQKALEDLLDEITPFFKSKIELLPPQQRKILDFIARTSFERNEGVTPKEIAERVRLKQNQASAQLKRLSDDGYVRAANVRGRSSFYVLSEPLMAIWYQMRFGRAAYEKRRWLITILKALYDQVELEGEYRSLDHRYSKFLASGDVARASDVLSHRYCLALAMDEVKPEYFDSYIEESLKIGSRERLSEDVQDPSIRNRLSKAAIERLVKEGIIPASEIDAVHSVSTAFRNGFDAYNEFRFEEAVAEYDKAIAILEDLVNVQGRRELANDLASAFINKGVSLGSLGRLDEAVAEYDKAIAILEDLVNVQGRRELANDLAIAFINKGVSLKSLGRLDGAVAEYDKAIDAIERASLTSLNREHFETRIKTMLNRIDCSVKEDIADRPGAALRDVIELLNQEKSTTFDDWITDIVLETARSGGMSALRRLNLSDESEARFFAIFRAAEFLESQDRSLIEKLSPEVKGAVEEIVGLLSGSPESDKRQIDV